MIRLVPGFAGAPTSLRDSLSDNTAGLAGANPGLPIHFVSVEPTRHWAEAWSLTSATERASISRLRTPGLQQSRLYGYAALRILLEAKLGVPAAALRFERSEHGKPRLHPDRGMHFNMSWREGRIALALSRTGPVGVDVEVATATNGLEKVARWLYSEAENRELAASEGDRTQLFLRMWTRKEALCKAAGMGIDHVRGISTLEPFATLPDDAGVTRTYGIETVDDSDCGWALSVAWHAASNS
jgi:phosphopantetheinyl transferase